VTRSRGLVAATTVVLASLGSPGALHARSGATLVAVVTAEPGSPLTLRVQSELQALGLDVLVVKPPDVGSTSRAPLERAARSVGAIAAVRIVASGEGRVEVWVADRVTGKALVRELDVPAGGASDAAVAVETVELLRASLMELHGGEPPRGDAPTTEKIDSLALPASPAPGVARLGLDVAAGAELGLRGLGPSADGAIGVWVRATERVGARFVGHTSLAPAHTSTQPGGVDVRSELLGAMATLTLAPPSSAWAPIVSVGVAAAHVSTTGTANPPYVGASDGAWTAAPLADLALAWAFAHDLRLRGDALGAWAVPALRVRTPAGEAGWWGEPALMVSVGVEILWAP
jgi:hypothetical protein